MPQTPNHGYNVPNKGDANWHQPLNDNFEDYDTDIEIRDQDANKGTYTPKQGAKILAIDTGIVYEGDGSSWNATLAQSRYGAPSSSGAAGNLVAGHASNSIGSGVSGATVSGGGSSSTPNTASGNYAAIGGGRDNTASAKDATIGGGRDNTASLPKSTVAGGEDNEAKDSNGTIGGGVNNVVAGASGTIAGGASNTVNVALGTVCGGRDNTASGGRATVAGGQDNEAGGQYSFAAGRKATASGDGTFVWGDSSNNGVTATQTDEFKVQAGGGAVIFSASDHSTGVNLQPGSGSWSAWSSRSAKSNVEPVDPGAALEGVRDLEIATWNYDGQDESVRHMGPMAEDFHDEFGLGGDRERISNVDADGVALAAIQGLAEQVDETHERIDDLEAENERLRDRLAAVEAEVGVDGASDQRAPADD